ncbi:MULTISPECIES: conjugative transfer relaxase/helicase TraI [Cronobacter]|nr:MULTISPECIES: conjugative transfer relaxase/helicase TraI [Cronobacter]EKA0987345.1 conjugative transfer relaxase/helicase TraI [Cronobacter sakazakii]ELY2793564.1 conjugative transfer relaxase/helicase TraI [Cronobacter sakazakii]ELY3981684.1 conjugative transfer relaxase/helicase TraI [Cronobacter sakazakii]ELY6251709.1 conjugative transfer relaxase/helicase TraI [Cronobacter sakazakii]MDI7683404.1 conjugative transfer relaxase/helicase TraI [Cronobacter sakazakii]
MMSVAPVASAGGAAQYYSNADNYYFLGNLQSLWMGEGAKKLGLEGPVRGEALTAILEGRLPDGSRLGKEINGNHVHRPGHDLTFSAPKSVSLLVLVGNDKALLDAHNHAVRVAAGYVEKLISARDTKDGVTSIVPTGKMVAAAFTHDTSRNLDPQLHTHLLVANMTESNGKWKALATDYIHGAGFIETVMKMQVTLGKIYRQALREQVEALGHKVESVGKNGLWEIKGVPEVVREEFSSRGKEIEGAVGAEATLRSRDVAAKDTRQAKVDPSRLRLRERWLGQMKDLGWDMQEYQNSLRSPEKDGAAEPALTQAEGPVAPEKKDAVPQTSLPEKGNAGKEKPEAATVRDVPAVSERTDREQSVQPEKADPGPEISMPEKGNAGKEKPEPATVRDEPAVYERTDREQSVQPEKADPGPEISMPEQPEPLHGKPAGKEPEPRPEVTDAVRMAVSQLSDSKTRFTWGELMLTATEFSEKLPDMKELRLAIDASLKDGLIVPLDSEKGVFTSRIHLLDELSLQAVSQELLKEGRVVSFTRPETYAPSALEPVEKDALVLMNAPAGVAGIRELAEQVTALSTAHGREVKVLASSAERATSLARSDTLKERLISRQQVLSGDFSLKPQSTLVIEGAEKLGLKETLILAGEARAQGAQLVFLDSAGRQANGNAMSVLEAAGVKRSRRTEPAPGLETAVISLPDKRVRYEALANRYAELSAGSEPVTAVVLGQREQKHLTGLIRDALQNAGQLERDGVTVEARTPVWLDSKTRRQPGSYRAGQVLEDRSDAREVKHYVIDRVHEDTRMLSLVDGDGVLSRHKISSLTADWRLYNSEQLNISEGEKLLAVAADRSTGLKAKDRLQVTAITPASIEVQRDGKTLTLPVDRPLYVTHGYVAAPGGRDNESGAVLAALNSRDITAQMMNTLAQSGSRAEVFTAETQDRAEARLQRMRHSSSPVQLVRNLSGKDDVSDAVNTLRDGVKGEAALAVARAIAEQREVSFSELKLTTAATALHNDISAIGEEIAAQVKSGELLTATVRGETRLIARSTWEMEKAIIRVIDEGKNTQQPLLEQVDPKLLAGLTAGQKQATQMVLGSRDQFIGVQGYAGVGKTTQVRALKSAIETLPKAGRPELLGLAPTHQAVKEMSEVGVVAQTVKSFLVEHDQRVAGGEKPDYQGRMFLIDESSMVGNQDTAALYQAIRAGGGRAVSMGDTAQFEAVDSGAPFKLVQERSPMDVAIMKEIVRQRDMQLKSAVSDIIDNRIDAALSRIASVTPDRVPRETGAALPAASVQETDSPVAAIVTDWLGRNPDARSRTIIITQLNRDRQAVNAGIHAALSARGELGQEAVTVPVLEKISHTRHEFNKTSAWQPGMVVKRGDRYQDVVAVDKNGSLVTVRDEEGKIALISPRELVVGDVELFSRSSMEVRAGDQLRFTATDRERGQAGNQKFTVEAVKDNGDVVLNGAAGRKIINPKEVLAEQHIDYAWAVTGYGAQGASSDYVISLEGTQDGRKALASQRAFYITASRAKDHVQIYTDGLADWTKAVKMPEREAKTAHDALKPETQRQQARAIWAMGQSLPRTAIGRTWLRHQGIDAQAMTARIIPATKRYPEPALALPLYDNNGKSSGLALVPIVAGDNGRLTQGEVRMVATDGSRGAVLQRSNNGKTVVVRSLQEALDTVRVRPQDGVVWQTGEEKPSIHLLKLSRGQADDSATLASTVLNAQEQERLAEQARAEAARQREMQLRDGQEKIRLPEEQPIILPADEKSAREAALPVIPDAGVLRRVAGETQPTGGDQNAVKQALLQEGGEVLMQNRGKTVDMQQIAGRVASELAEQSRAELPRQESATERGRQPEQEERGHTRHIQKER